MYNSGNKLSITYITVQYRTCGRVTIYEYILSIKSETVLTMGTQFGNNVRGSVI